MKFKIPTRIRIDLAGYHHIINRGVDRMNVFRHDEHFIEVESKNERNKATMRAYKDGYRKEVEI